MTQDETWLLKEKYNGVPNAAFEADRERLRMGEPLAYVIGWVPFLGVRIALDSRPLIPRPETEYWTEYVITAMKKDVASASRILDLCAGSGCIGIAVLHAISDAKVDFAEIDTRHHDTIRMNLARNDIDESRARIFGGDLFAQITDRYDYILANPPYIDPALDRTTESVRTFEPHDALYGGTRGMALIARIIRDASRVLTPAGTAVIEHEPEQSAAIRRLGEASGFRSETHTDQFGVQRFTVLMLY